MTLTWILIGGGLTLVCCLLVAWALLKSASKEAPGPPDDREETDRE
jgi:hypothetical protein